jgi:hypothetical protein
MVCNDHVEGLRAKRQIPGIAEHEGDASLWQPEFARESEISRDQATEFEPVRCLISSAGTYFKDAKSAGGVLSVR